MSNDLWKYVENMTLMEVVPRGGSSNVQSAVNDIQNQFYALKFTLNDDKCKEMRIQFNKDNANQQLRPVTINGKQAKLIFENGTVIKTILLKRHPKDCTFCDS